MEELADLSIVPQPLKQRLNQRQLTDYRNHRVRCLEWTLSFGKEAAKAEGYTFQTIKPHSHRMDQFYRWVWNEEDQYTAEVTLRMRTSICGCWR